MKANVSLTLTDIRENERETKEMQHCAEGIWSTITNYISKYVTIDKDAIFKEPDWPHLWDKK